MIIVGLTGGIGAGKSFVANKFNEKGIPIYNSDIRAKELMQTNSKIKTELISKFGTNVYVNNSLNRKLLADSIFTDKSLIAWINNLVHPIVKLDFDEWVKNQKALIVFKEAAILIESGAYKQCDKIIVVTAPKEIKVKRIMLRDNLTLKQINDRITNQISDIERLKYADFTIINDGIKVVSIQVDKIYNKLQSIDC